MHPFEYKAPTEGQVEQIKTVRDACKDLHNILLSLPESRARSLAITKLEATSMWANKGIVFS